MKTIHCCVDISGILRSESLDGAMTDTETGHVLSDMEARKYLNECLEKGWKVLPMGDCDNFDYQTGCKGHVHAEPSSEKALAFCSDGERRENEAEG